MVETHKRSLVKAISYRVLGSSATGAIGWWLTGSLRIGAAVGIADTVIKLGLYYAHERIWHRCSWGLEEDRMNDGGGI